ncbi:MAG: hypothetical protein KDD25_01570 [Bdellovibrionales bacterium]|nr:hypothetical protein [Bdellovibrionales bacterium]
MSFFSNLAFFLLALVAYSQSAFSYWEYEGFSGKDNKIESYGRTNILKDHYPSNWEGFGKELSYECLCTQDTKKTLSSLVKKYIGTNTSGVSSGFRQSFSFANSAKVAMEVTGFTFENVITLEKAFESLKIKNKSSRFAFMKTKRSIYIAEKMEKVPARGFLHFVRGYDYSNNK